MQPSFPPPDQPAATMADSGGPSLEDVRALARLLRESGLSELSIASTDEAARASLTLRRTPESSGVVAVATPVAAPKAAASAPLAATMASSAKSGTAATSKTLAAPQPEVAAEATLKTSSGEIMATAVGLFRDAKPPLGVGDEVKTGQVVGFVESLKVPSEVHAPHAGRVSELLCEAGQGVEYGQVLMRLEPTAETEAPQGELV